MILASCFGKGSAPNLVSFSKDREGVDVGEELKGYWKSLYDDTLLRYSCDIMTT